MNKLKELWGCPICKRATSIVVWFSAEPQKHSKKFYTSESPLIVCSFCDMAWIHSDLNWGMRQIPWMSPQ